MDGEQGLDRSQLADPPVIAQVHRDHGGLPVVAVDYVRLEVYPAKSLDDRFREEREALSVVVLAIKRIAHEVLLVVDEVVGHASVLELEDAAVCAPPAE